MNIRSHPAVRRFLKWEQSEDPSFRAKDLTFLSIDHGRGSLGDLSDFPQLNKVHYERWSSPRPPELPRALWSLAAWDTDLTTVEWVADFPELWGLDLRRTLVTDLRPLLGHPSLFSFQYQACPFDEHSWYEIIPNRPRYRGIPKDFPESAWKVTRTLYEAGLPIVAFVDNYGDLRLVQPGWHIARGLMSIPADEVQAALAAHAHIDLPTFVNETRVRRGSEPYTLEQMYPEPQHETDPPAGPPD
jgi:hypothetical protein